MIKHVEFEYECEYCGETFDDEDDAVEHECLCKQKDAVQRLVDAGRVSDVKELISEECHNCKNSVFAGHRCWRNKGSLVPCVSAAEGSGEKG